MRTTVTLDLDVEPLIRSAMKQRGLSLKEVLNCAVRADLAQNSSKKIQFTPKTFHLGPEQNFRWDKALAAADAIEDEELVQKTSLGK